MEKIVKNAKIATEVWNALNEEQQVSIGKYFHLRPTDSGITIVSTLPFLPMRGITDVKGEEGLREKLLSIDTSFKNLTSDDYNKAREAAKLIGFPVRVRELKKVIEPDDFLEEDRQTMMINSMNGDKNLSKALGSGGKMKFIASELILKGTVGRIDIVGFDEPYLYFFELKKDRTTKVEQLSNYINSYSDEKNVKILQELLANYPINPLENYDEKIKGIMVMRYAENSSLDWKKIANDDGIEILFYRTSLSYEKA